MNSFFLETPYLLGGFLLVVMLIAWYAWLQSGQRMALVVALIVTLVSGILLTVNIMVITDREAIREFILDSAKELNENNKDFIKNIVSPRASAEVQAAMFMLPRIQFDEARITRIHAIDIDDSEAIKTAQVRMNVFVKGSIEQIQFNAPRWILLDMIEVPANGSSATGTSRWQITHMEHRDPHHEFINR